MNASKDDPTLPLAWPARGRIMQPGAEEIAHIYFELNYSHGWLITMRYLWLSKTPDQNVLFSFLKHV